MSVFRLKTLNLASNHLKVLPEDISMMLKLEELDLHDNLLKELPDSIMKLSKIVKMNLNDNRIRYFPQGFEDYALNRQVGCKHFVYLFQTLFEKFKPSVQFIYNCLSVCFIKTFFTFF